MRADHNLISPAISTVAALAAVACMPFVAPEDQVLIPAQARMRRGGGRCGGGYGGDENEELVTKGFIPGGRKKEL